MKLGPILEGSKIPLYPKFQVAVTGIKFDTSNCSPSSGSPNQTPLIKVVVYILLKLIKFASLCRRMPAKKFMFPFATKKSVVPISAK